MSDPTPPTRASGRQRDHRTDQALIEAVLDLVSEGSTLAGLSLVAIAERAGVSRNTLYRRWKTKDALYLDVLASLNKPVPPLPGRSVRGDIIEVLSVLAERSTDPRASQMLRALGAEQQGFPELHARYFAEIVAPRRDGLLQIIARGIAQGEIRPDVDADLAADLLVDPILARAAAGTTAPLDPRTTSEQIVDLAFAGLAPRPTRGHTNGPLASRIP